MTELRTRPNYPEQLIITAAAGGHCQHCQHEVVCQVDSFAIVSSVFSLLLLLLLLLTPAAMHVQGSALAPAASPRPMSCSWTNSATELGVGKTFSTFFFKSCGKGGKGKVFKKVAVVFEESSVAYCRDL